ncbi:MAG: phosphoribosylamine--glycine ligase [Chloroflexota bacterium]|nr:MAG: phosphoribosylamine--glycine ligase [Chloroflexota bacterium]
MNVLIIGSGGREHALAWKLAQPASGRAERTRLFILPGNPGTARLGKNLMVTIDAREPRHAGIVRLAQEHAIELVVIGPEAPLADGLADALRSAGLRVFGPSKQAAQIEASKAFAKDFMQRHGIPTAAHNTFTRYEDALDFVRQTPPESIVIKASGLAAGKGVYLPDTRAETESVLHALLVDGSLGASGQTVVIEERLTGREVSILAFTDGTTVIPMPPVQDHKRLMSGDLGPNTGGMGTYAPSPACPPELLKQVTTDILQPTVDGLWAEGIPFNGVLYAGMILTPDGPKALEFNCRFGDPETQVILPLLDSDLLEVLMACAEGRLAEAAEGVKWKTGGAVCIVAASPGYPDKVVTGQAITGLEQLIEPLVWPDGEGLVVFHAGTAIQDGRLVSSGGRVLGVTAWAGSLPEAISKAYAGMSQVHFEGMQYRKDIGRDILKSHASEKKSAYEAAGVSIQAGNRAVSLMRQSVRSTFNTQVLSDVGAFGGLYQATGLKAMDDPVLVASTDGIGTKVHLASVAGRISGLGYDIVNHCVNDILVQGAVPLFFLDYFASDHVVPEQVAELVASVSAACRQAGCALLGGETAEMPGVYAEGRFDVAGTIVGVVERSRILPRGDIHTGDLLLGLASSGPHTNGYSLIRRIFADVPLEHIYPELGVPLAEALLAPHRSYLHLLSPLLSAPGGSPIKALAHITGGGFVDNIPRIFPAGLGGCIRHDAWPASPLFSLIREKGQVDEEEMYHVFNMGIGMIVIVAPDEIERVQLSLPETTWVIGEVVEGNGVKII